MSSAGKFISLACCLFHLAASRSQLVRREDHKVATDSIANSSEESGSETAAFVGQDEHSDVDDDNEEDFGVSAIEVTATGEAEVAAARRRSRRRRRPTTTTTTTTAKQHAAGAPNFVIFLMDDMGYGDAGYTNQACPTTLEGVDYLCPPTTHTPHIDQMASEGIIFQSFYSAAVICTPSRAGMLTGRYPIRTGLYPFVFDPQSMHGLMQGEHTIAETLSDAGYRSYMVGKWHLGHTAGHLPHDHGFHQWKGMPWSHNMCPCPLSETNMNGLTNNVGCPSRLGNNAKVGGTKKCLCESYGRYPPCPYMENNQVTAQPQVLKGLTQKWVDDAKGFITGHKNDYPDKPYFLLVSFVEPHFPMFLADRFKGTVNNSQVHSVYAQTMAQVDDAVGQIMDVVRSATPNTVAFLTSDNGPSLAWRDWGGSPGQLRCGKGSTWEGGSRVPGIFWYPSQASEYPPRTLAAKVVGSQIDLMPTMMSLAGLDGVWEGLKQSRALDGIDLTPVLKGTTDHGRDHFFFYGSDNNIRDWTRGRAPNRRLNDDQVSGIDAVRFSMDEKAYKVFWKSTIAEGHTSAPKSLCRRTNQNMLEIYAKPVIYELLADPGENNPLTVDSAEWTKAKNRANELKEDASVCKTVRENCYNEIMASSGRRKHRNRFVMFKRTKRAQIAWRGWKAGRTFPKAYSYTYSTSRSLLEVGRGEAASNSSMDEDQDDTAEYGDQEDNTDEYEDAYGMFD